MMRTSNFAEDARRMTDGEIAASMRVLADEQARRKAALPSYFEMCDMGERPLLTPQVTEPEAECPKCGYRMKYVGNKPGGQLFYCFTCQDYKFA